MKISTQLNKRLFQLKGIRSYVNIYFQEALSEMKLKNKLLTNRINNAYLLKNLFTSIEQTYQLRSSFYQQKTMDLGNLYILISEKIKLSGINNNQLVQKMLNSWNQQPNNYLIAIGELAIQFAEQQKIIPIFSLKKNDQSQAEKIQLLIYEYYQTKKVNQVIFVFNSNKIKEYMVTVLPAKNLLLNNLNDQKLSINLKPLKIYPNLNKMVETIEFLYLKDVVSGLITEATIYPLKQKVAKLDGKLKEIDKKIWQTKIQLNRLRTESENEEILLLSE